MGRMLNADDTKVLKDTPKELTDKNLFAYCDNNPIMRKDDSGDMWQLAGAGGGVWALSVSNAWNPVGLATLGIIAGGCLIYSGYRYYKSISYAKKKSSQSQNAPIGRANRKKQGREVNQKKRTKSNFKSRSNKNPNRPLKKHTPSRKGHKKY